MKDLRERCEKLAKKLTIPRFEAKITDLIEAFAREIRNEVLEEAAKVADEVLNNLAADDVGDQYIVDAQKDTATTIRNCIALRAHALATSTSEENA